MTVPIIDLANFSDHKETITKQLLEAARETGFFYLKNHSVRLADATRMFKAAQKFFDLPDDVKSSYAFERQRNAGWEKLAQACVEISRTRGLGWRALRSGCPVITCAVSRRCCCTGPAFYRHC